MPTRSVRGAALAITAALILMAMPTSSDRSSAVAAVSVNCGLFTSKVYSQLFPSNKAQLMAARGDLAVSARASGAVDTRPTPGMASLAGDTTTRAVHRLYRKSNGNYFYSLKPAEIQRARGLGYVDQGAVFYASTKSASCLIPVYSFYRSGRHQFTSVAAERNALAKAGWKQEGIRFYLGKPQSVITFAVYPDTQQEVLRNNDTRFAARSRWVLDSQPLLTTKYVMHTGDVVNWDTVGHDQYSRALRGMSVLNRSLSYSMAAGNHDTAAVGPGGSAADPVNSPSLVRNTATFNAYFGSLAKFQGTYEPNRMENSYSRFSAGGLNWMVITLELWPRREAVAWARQLVASHPKDNVVVVTHSYLTASGTIEQKNGGYGSTSPQYLYDNLIKLYPNIKMVLSGHTGSATWRRDTGVKGNAIYSFLLAMHSGTTNPTRMIEVNTTAGLVSSYVYAPSTKTSYTTSRVAPQKINWSR